MYMQCDWFIGRGSSVGSEAVCDYLLQADPISKPASGTFFREDLVMKIFLLASRWPVSYNISVNGSKINKNRNVL